MFFLPILLVCAIQAGFTGDGDSGPTCIKFYDRPEVHYGTHEECAERLREMVEAVKENPRWLAMALPGPKHYRGHCYVPVIDEKAT